MVRLRCIGVGRLADVEQGRALVEVDLDCLDGEPRRSCLIPAGALNGAAITTVEGIGTPEHLAPVQAAFHEHYGSQCGFCTPGFLLATHALIERSPGADRAQIDEALAGHACRCTGYVKILEAVEAAVGGAK